MTSIQRKHKQRAGWRKTVPEWWATVPDGEKKVIQAIVRMLRSAKASQLAEVSRAAAKWERGIGCFIKVRLMHARPRRRGMSLGGTEK